MDRSPGLYMMTSITAVMFGIPGRLTWRPKGHRLTTVTATAAPTGNLSQAVAHSSSATGFVCPTLFSVSRSFVSVELLDNLTRNCQFHARPAFVEAFVLCPTGLRIPRTVSELGYSFLVVVGKLLGNRAIFREVRKTVGHLAWTA